MVPSVVYVREDIMEIWFILVLIAGGAVIWFYRAADAFVAGALAESPCLVELQLERQRQRELQRIADVRTVIADVKRGRDQLAGRFMELMKTEPLEVAKHQAGFKAAWKQFLSVIDALYGPSLVNQALRDCGLTRQD